MPRLGIVPILIAALLSMAPVQADSLSGQNLPAAPDGNGCLDGQDPTGTAQAAKMLAGLKDAIPAPACPLFELCPGSGRTKLWAQQRVDADLMREELERMGVKPGHTKVAVIDSGFDAAGNAAKLGDHDATLARGYPDAGDPTRDESGHGHGTAVAGLIGAANGVGVAPDAKLTVYRYLPADGAKPPLLGLSTTIRRACDDGNEVINVSSGRDQGFGVDSPLLLRNVDKDDKDFIEQLGAKGCLLVASAGNTTMDWRAQADDRDDAYLIVEASSENRKRAAFSSMGEISAPGDKVFTLTSHEAGFPAGEEPETCGSDSGAFESGTSFSSPITAGIAAEVLGVLKLRPAYSKLSNPRRITLLNRILAGSESGGSVNGLRAVLIAERWTTSSGSDALPTAAELADLLKTSPPDFCAGPRPSCLALSDCASVVRCYNKARKIIRACGTPDPETVSDVLKLAVQGKDLQAASYWIGVLAETPGVPKDIFRNSAALVWKTFMALWRVGETAAASAPGTDTTPSNFDFDISIDLLPSYVATGADSRLAFKLALQSWDARQRLTAAPSVDSNHDAQRALALFRSYLNVHGPDATLGFVKDWVVAIEKGLDTEDVLIALRMLSGMIADPAFEGLSKKLAALELALYDTLNQGNPVAVFDGPELALLKPMMERNKDRLEKSVRTGLSQNSMRSLGAYQLAYLLRFPEALAPPRSIEIALAALSDFRAGSHRNAFADNSITALSLDAIEIGSENASPPMRAALEKSVLGALSASPNLSAMTAALDWAHKRATAQLPDTLIDSAAESQIERHALDTMTRGTSEMTAARFSDNLAMLLVAGPNLAGNAHDEKSSQQALDAFAVWSGRNYLAALSKPADAEQTRLRRQDYTLLKAFLKIIKIKRAPAPGGEARQILALLRAKLANPPKAAAAEALALLDLLPQSH